LKAHAEQQTEKLTYVMRSCEERILTSLEGKLSDVCDQVVQLAGRVTQLEEELKKLQALKTNFDKLEAKIEKVHSRGDDIQHLEFEIADMRSLEKQVGELSAKISAQENADVQCEVRLHGVPYKEVESLKTLFNTLSFSLGITPAPKLLEIFRVKTRNETSTIVDPIIKLKFEHLRDKISMLRHAAEYRRTHKKPLVLGLLGLNSNAAIYLNEQITKEN